MLSTSDYLMEHQPLYIPLAKNTTAEFLLYVRHMRLNHYDDRPSIQNGILWF